MVIVFSGEGSAEGRQIKEILAHCRVDFIVTSNPLCLKSDIKNGTVLFADSTDKFKKQFIPKGFTGICEDKNKTALKIFGASYTPVITCGMSAKNTVTVSSIEEKSRLLSLQRTITDYNGKEIDPAEFKITLSKNYSHFAVMSSAVILLLNGIIPEDF